MWLLLPLILLFFVIKFIWQRRRAYRHKRALTQQLRTWAGQQTMLDPTLQQWIAGLSTAEATVLVELLQGYCTSLNWELSWLFAPQIKKAPALQQALEESVMVYARSILHSLQLEEDVRTYHAYLALMRRPAERRQRWLVQRLYAGLHAAGLTAPEEQRVKRGFFIRRSVRKTAEKPPPPKAQIAAIQQAFDHHPVLAMTLLKQALSEEALKSIQQAKQAMPPPIVAMARVVAA